MTKSTPEQLRAFVATTLVTAAIVGTVPRSTLADRPGEDNAEQPAASTQKNADSRTMTVQVLDEVGQPLSGAHVFASIWEMPGAKDYPNRDYKTDENGRARIAIPQRLQILRLWCSKEGHVPFSVNFARGTHEEGRLIPNEYEFRLPQGDRLSGRVVDADGDPIANARVEVMLDVDAPVRRVNPDPTIDTWLATEDDAPVSDKNGRWEIANAPPPPEHGRDYEFRLQVTHPDFAGDTRWGELQQQQGITTEHLRRGTATVTLDRGIMVSGEITGPDGKTVSRGLVIWSHDPGSAQRVNKIPIDNQGHYETKRLAPGKLSFTVVAPGFAPTRQIVQVNAASDKLDFQLKPGNRLRIQLVDQDGKPVSNAYVVVRQWRGTEVLYTYQHAKVGGPGIPRRANDDGVYEWDWAPKDAVTYRVRADGFSSKEVSLVAKSKPHVVTLAPNRMVAGKVTDAATGKPVKRFVAMPVIVFRPDFYHTRTTDAKVGRDGCYELPLVGSADPEDRYRVRFEAEGYRSAISEESFGPLDGRATLNFRLQPAPPRQGQVVDANGRPVENATVLEASPTDVPRTANGKPEAYASRPVHTDARGRFQMHATTEPVLVRVYDDSGFAEKAVAPHEEAIGQLRLKPWASLSGRLTQAGRSISGQSVRFYPLVDRGLIQPRFQDSYYATTDADGRFRFDRLPPITGSLKATLGPWEESPLTSSEAIPLELSPGEHREVTLGGQGATISGRVVATGRSNEDFSKQWSINYLVSRNRGVDYPKEATPLSFDPAGPLQPEWLRQADFRSWLATRLNYFVKLSDDGRLQIHGVPPGEYDLLIQLYEEPAGCLVETVGEKVVPITVTAEQAASGPVEIGNIEVKCRIGPRVGSDMRVFRFTDTGGRVRRVDDLQGRYVLLHVWATWCAPCLRSMPMLEASVERYSDAPLTVVGLNVDDDASTAKAMAEQHGWDWAQNYLGSQSDLMRQLAVSSVPAYYLIGPEGKLLGSANEWQQIERLLGGELH